jgi:hypothetical protein
MATNMRGICRHARQILDHCTDGARLDSHGMSPHHTTWTAAWAAIELLKRPCPRSLFLLLVFN